MLFLIYLSHTQTEPDNDFEYFTLLKNQRLTAIPDIGKVPTHYDSTTMLLPHIMTDRKHKLYNHHLNVIIWIISDFYLEMLCLWHQVMEWCYSWF